jgi:sugar phosphate isomerase/epimerase
MRGKPIGLQLYPFRDALADDFEGSLARIAEIGYVAVEFLGLHGLTPARVAEIAARHGLQVCSSHVPLPAEASADAVLDEASALGYQIAVAGLGADEYGSEEQTRQAGARFQDAAVLLGQHGLRLAMHNHAWEFSASYGGQFVWDIVMQSAPDLLGELDVYWAAFGALSDPVEIVAAYRSRLPLLHIKDGELGETAVHTPVGSGDLDIPAVIDAADPDVVEWIIVDLLEGPDADMFESARESHRYLTVEGLAEARR